MKGGLLRQAAYLRRPRLLAAVAAFCALTAGGYYYFRSYSETEGLRRQARAAMDDCDFERAQVRLKAYLATRPDDGEGQFLLARACRRARVEDFDQAHKSLDEARRLGWSGVDVALETVMLDVQEHGASGKNESTLRQYLESKEPGQGLALEALARGSLLENRLEAANGWLNAWVDFTPDDWYARLWRAAFFEYMNKANLAIPDLQFVLQKRPGDEEVGKRLGLMLVQSGYDYDEARKRLESYRRNHPDDADVLVGIARCQRMLGQTEAAETLLKQVVAAHADQKDALLTLALIESDRGNALEAAECLRRLKPLAGQYHGPEELEQLRRLEPTPNHADLSHWKRTVLTLDAAVLRRLGRDEEARRDEEEAERLTADTEELQRTLRLKQASPRDGALMDRLGVLYLRLGMVEEGIASLEQALRDRPDDSAAHRALADFYASRPDPESRRRAEEHRRLAGAAPPPSPDPQRPKAQ